MMSSRKQVSGTTASYRLLSLIGSSRCFMEQTLCTLYLAIALLGCLYYYATNGMLQDVLNNVTMSDLCRIYSVRKHRI